MAESETTARATHQGICVSCERLLPKSNFRRDAAGRHTCWCEACREAAAKRWGVEGDLVESVYALYVLEQVWKAEAEAVTQIRIQMGEEHPNELPTLHNKIVSYDRIRFSRIPERLHRFHVEAREAWYRGINMVAPDTAVPVEVQS